MKDPRLSPVLIAAIADLAVAPSLLLLDYDGTLVPYAPRPELARPDASLLALLQALSGSHEVHLVSGRDRHALEEWFGHLAVGLHAEHGFWSRDCRGWVARDGVDLSWLREVGELLARFARSTSGSLVEEKSSGLAWHFRRTEQQLATRRLHELRDALERWPERCRFDVIEGSKVLEVRARHVTKADVAARLLGATGRRPVLAAGDDRTDEDLFAPLPPDAVTIKVGEAPSIARFRVPDPVTLRELLLSLVADH